MELYLLSFLLIFSSLAAKVCEATDAPCIIDRMRQTFIARRESRVERSPHDRLIDLTINVNHNFWTRTVPPEVLMRGFASSDYSDRNLFSFLLGDRRYEIQSWDHSRTLEFHLSQGQSLQKSMDLTDQEIADRIIREVKLKSISKYIGEQFSHSTIFLKSSEKSGTSLHFAPRGRSISSPVRYAKGTLCGEFSRSHSGFSSEPLAYVIQIRAKDEPYLLGITSDEFVVLSHIRKEAVEGAYIGYPLRKITSNDAKDAGRSFPLEWFYVETVPSKKSRGLPAFNIYQASEKDQGAAVNKDAIILKYDASDAMSRKLAAKFARDHPHSHLKNLLSAMLSPDGHPVGELTLSPQNKVKGRNAEWMEDELGTLWHVKPDSQHAELQTSATVISSGVYKALGFQAPDASIVYVKGKRYSAIRSLGDNVTFSYLDDLDTSEFRQLRVVVALLRDYDRLASYPPNNYRLPNNRFGVLDFDGSLGSKARGDFKEGPVFSDAIGSFPADQTGAEMLDLFRPKLPAEHSWKQLTVKDKAKLIRRLKSLNDSAIDKIVDSAQFTHENDSAYMKNALKRRRDAMISFLTSG